MESVRQPAETVADWAKSPVVIAAAYFYRRSVAVYTTYGLLQLYFEYDASAGWRRLSSHELASRLPADMSSILLLGLKSHSTEGHYCSLRPAGSAPPPASASGAAARSWSGRAGDSGAASAAGSLNTLELYLASKPASGQLAGDGTSNPASGLEEMVADASTFGLAVVPADLKGDGLYDALYKQARHCSSEGPIIFTRMRCLAVFYLLPCES